MSEISSVLDEQQRYYDDRAPEYDDWWYRRGSFDQGAAANAQWREEAAIVDEALRQAALSGDVLELAAGTGIWSQKLLQSATSLTLVDGSAQMLARNAVAGDAKVRTVQADIFRWRSDRSYDAVAFGFWISHVPRALLQSFLGSVAHHLREGGKVFFVDNRPLPEALAPHVVDLKGELMTRKLANGQTSTIVKNYYTRDELTAACDAAGLAVEVRETPTLFQYGLGHRR